MEDDDLTLFLNAIKGHPFEAVFFVTVFTGLRQGEVLGLTWDCVNFENNLLFINKQHSRDKITNKYQFSSLKNDKPRTIEVAPAVMEVLRQQKQRQEQWAKDYDGIWNNEKNLVFTTQTGRFLCNCTVCKHFKTIVRELGMDECRFHDLRHTYAVNSLKSGDDIKTVQGNLGHHTASFTLDTYGHVTAGMRHTSANHMEQYIHTVASHKGSE